MRVSFTALLFSMLMIAAIIAAEPARNRELSFQKLPLRQGERIAAIQIDITGAAFQKVSVPHDWGLEVTPPVGDFCTLKATAQHGASFLFSTSPELNNFVTLVDSPQLARPFRVEAQITGYSYDPKTQKEEQRVIKLPKECIVIE